MHLREVDDTKIELSLRVSSYEPTMMTALFLSVSSLLILTIHGCSCPSKSVSNLVTFNAGLTPDNLVPQYEARKEALKQTVSHLSVPDNITASWGFDTTTYCSTGFVTGGPGILLSHLCLR